MGGLSGVGGSTRCTRRESHNRTLPLRVKLVEVLCLDYAVKTKNLNKLVLRASAAVMRWFGSHLTMLLIRVHSPLYVVIVSVAVD